MNTHYEYINMVKLPFKGKTTKWRVMSNHDGRLLGLIRWYSPWRKYCFMPVGDTVFNAGCLEHVCDFIRQLMEERKK